MSLGKKDIVYNISTKARLSKSQSNQILNSFIDIIKTNSSNRFVKLPNFGTFYYKKTPSRIGRNPKTKESKTISARKVILFRASKDFKNFVNNRINE